jgi:hypothetical protein
MSMKKIRAVLERVKGHSPHAADVREAEEALAEVEAIERVAKEQRSAKTDRLSGTGFGLLMVISEDAP